MLMKLTYKENTNLLSAPYENKNESELVIRMLQDDSACFVLIAIVYISIYILVFVY